MRNADLSAIGALRLERSPPARIQRRHDPVGFRPAVPGYGRSALREGLPRLDGFVPAPGIPEQDPRAVPRGWEHPSGAGPADGGPLWGARGREPRAGLRFDAPVQPGGYAWWYIDALSDDGRFGLTVIAFVGSVFSPYYALARRGGRRPDPLNFCGLNVALYGISGPSWSLTERGRSRLSRAETTLQIGPSSLAWDGTTLEIRVDEVTAPLPRRLRGTIRVHPRAISDQTFDLDAAGRHRWQPVSPCARVEVNLTAPSLRWSGHGYLDTNDGDEPLADAFSQWHWSRASLERGTAVLYDVTRKDGSQASVALRFDPSGTVTDEESPSSARLPQTRWRVERETPADWGCQPSVRHTLEDGPFYARSVLQSCLFGEPVTAMHESLSLDRFSKPWVQAMLPFRMPRRPS